MKPYFVISILLTIVLSSFQSYAQNKKPDRTNMPKDGIISGKIIDADINKPIEYTNIVLYKSKDSSMVTGTISSSNGSFEMSKLAYGQYYIEANFIGYHKKTIPNIRINPRKKTFNVGTILLNQASDELDNVEIVADRAHVEYKIDKKIINVGQDINATSGSAVDVLDNVPSVAVDIDGNVSLRGSSKFTVLIDGRPSVIQGSDVLEQIPASSIKNIEIITNPSAKYDPDGMAGILNIVTKKNMLNGLSGLVNTTIGTNSKHKADMLFSYRTSKFTVFGGFDYQDFNSEGTLALENESYTFDTIESISKLNDTEYTNTYGDRNRKRYGYKVKLGFDYSLSRNTIISLSGNFGSRSHNKSSYSTITNWMDSETNRNYSIANGASTRGNDYYSLNFNLQHKFQKEGHEIQAMAYYSAKTGEAIEDKKEYESNIDWEKVNLSTLRTNEGEESTRLRLKIDYTLPINEFNKLEIGYQTRYEEEYEDFLFEEFDINSNDWIKNSDYSSDMNFEKAIHSAYATFTGKLLSTGIEYKAGFRGEYTKRTIQHQKTDQANVIDRPDWFPSIHLSKQFGKKNQVMASYSRRIDRPGGRELDAFYKYMNQYNIRFGNPETQPEYTDSYELSYMLKFGKSFISLEAYYRKTNNMITRLKLSKSEALDYFTENNSEYIDYINELNDNVMVHTYTNMNRDHSLGTELMINFEPLSWLRINASGNIYKYRIEGNLSDDEVNKESTNWNARLNTTFTFSPKSRLQISGFYRGPSITTQGDHEAMYMCNAAYRHDFFKKKLTVTLQIKDIMSSRRYESYSTGSDYKSYIKFEGEGITGLLSLSYKINNYKQKRTKGENGGDSEGDDYNEQ